MPYQLPSQIAYDSAALLRAQAAIATVHMGNGYERAPLNHLIRSVRPAPNPIGEMGATFGTAPISLIQINANDAWFYNERISKTKSVTNSYGPENKVYTPVRDGLKLSSGRITIEDVFPTIADYEDVRLAVSFYAHQAAQMGRLMGGNIADRQMATLYGFRGVNAGIWSSDEHLIDSAGQTLAQMADSQFMKEIINPLQNHGNTNDANAEKVRPLTRAVGLWDGDIAKNLWDSSYSMDLATATDSADDMVSWSQFRGLCTFINQVQNENRTDIPFVPARIGGLRDGSGEAMANPSYDAPVLLINYETKQQLLGDDDWQKFQLALAEYMGKSSGLQNHKLGMYENVVFNIFDKVPMLKGGSNSDVNIAPILALGRGALCITYSRKEPRYNFGDITNIRMRRFMETPFACKVSTFQQRNTRGQEQSSAPYANFGVVRPAFPDGANNGKKTDVGVVAMFTALPS